MRVLAACEFSGRVRDAFRGLGHEAFSCDLEPSEGTFTQYHIQGDVREYLQGWDLIIGFPPCTYLSKIRNRGFEPNWFIEERQRAVEFVHTLYDSDCPRVAIENPVGRLSTLWRKPDQIVHPFYFGDPYEKMTCLWLRGLPQLYIEEEFYHSGARAPWCYWTRDSRKRSMTFPGVARAMARQWGAL